MGQSEVPGRCRWAPNCAFLALWGVFGSICLAPYLARLKHPSLYSDDVTRLADLQVMPLREMLVRPFNEHLAPLFEIVSAATWRCSGESLTAAPLGFMLASYVPFLLVLGMLVILARRELGSTTAALAAMALFSISTVAFETVAWYSASSFMWALLGTLAAWYASSRACDASRDRGRLGWWGASALAALAAPAFSAIGILAAPTGIVTATRPRTRSGSRWAIAASVAPAVGSLAYLALASVFRYRQILTDSIEHNGDLRTGLLSVARAPIDVLLPGLIGMPSLDELLAPRGFDIAMFGMALAAILACSWSSPRRSAILGGLVLIVGGYGVTYCVRNAHGSHWTLRVERYHLFPQLGISLLLAAAFRPWLSRLDSRPMRSLVAAITLAALLLTLHHGEIMHKSRFYRFPDQPKTLAALKDLGNLCKRYGITRPQALAALDPIRTRWFDRDDNALMMLAPMVPVSCIPNDLVRSTLLSVLTAAQREALCGGMDASPYLCPAVDLVPVAVGRLVDALRVRETGTDGHYVSAGRPSYLEFTLNDTHPQDTADARFLCIPSEARDKAMEVWWANRAGDWSETRSIRWQPDSKRPAQPWAIPLDRLPHWDTAGARRVRLCFRAKGPVVIGTPTLLR